jgi:hypothetical protein
MGLGGGGDGDLVGVELILGGGGRIETGLVNGLDIDVDFCGELIAWLRNGKAIEEPGKTAFIPVLTSGLDNREPMSKPRVLSFIIMLIFFMPLSIR